MRSRILLFIGLGIGLAAVVVISVLNPSPYQFQGSLIEPSLPAADFTLTDQFSQPFSMSDQEGKVVLLFFGYTHCPDICPVTLAEYRDIAVDLGQDASKVRLVFITVDPDRDTIEVLKQHIGYFSQDITGLTGDRPTLEEVWKSYGVFVAKQENTGSAAGYLVDHTARVFLVDQAGNLRLTYPFGFEKDKLLADIRHLIDDGK